MVSRATRRTAAQWSRVMSVPAVLLLAASCGGERAQPAADSSGGVPPGAAPAVPPAASAAGAPVGGETSTLPQGAADAQGAFRLQGNEPFWAVQVRTEGLIYTTPDYPNGIRFPATAPQQQGSAMRWVAVTQAPEAHTLEVSLEEKACRDTMADRQWTHTATIIFDGARRTGCGEKAPQ